MKSKFPSGVQQFATPRKVAVVKPWHIINVVNRDSSCYEVYL